MRQNRPAAGRSNTVPKTMIDPTDEPVLDGRRGWRIADEVEADEVARLSAGSAGRDLLASDRVDELAGTGGGPIRPGCVLTADPDGVTCREDDAEEGGVQ